MESMRQIWEEIFVNELQLEPKNINVLISDTPLSSKEKKQEIASILFEKTNVKSLSLMNSAVLSLFSTGRTRYVLIGNFHFSGIVVECGQGSCYTVPIFEGYALPHAI